MQKRNKNHAGNGNETLRPAPKQFEVSFAIERAETNEVCLSGDFNGWSATNLPMIRQGACRWEKLACSHARNLVSA